MKDFFHSDDGLLRDMKEECAAKDARIAELEASLCRALDAGHEFGLQVGDARVAHLEKQVAALRAVLERVRDEAICSDDWILPQRHDDKDIMDAVNDVLDATK